MRLSTLLGPELSTLDEASLRAALDEFHSEDVVEFLRSLPDAEVARVLRALPPDVTADLIERLDLDHQVELFSALSPNDAAEILSEMSPDDRADVLDELEEDEQKLIFERLAEADPEALEEAQELLRFDSSTAGGIMTTEFVALSPDTKAWAAIDAIRKQAKENNVETIYYAYVIGNGGRLLGVASLREIILADPATSLSEIMAEKIVKVTADTDQEEVARVIARYDLAALPVVDQHDVMLGLVTVDDVVDVVIEEATEDAQRMAAMVPFEESYFATRIVDFVWKRGVWLIVLFFGQFLTASVMESNMDALHAMVDLSIFIPLIISSGGNAGSQSSTLIIRAMSVGEASLRDWWRVLFRELTIGSVLGLALGGIGFLRVYWSHHTADAASFGLTVAGSILAVVTLASLVGGLLPMLIRRLGLDPAVSSTPFIASVIDVVGLIVYFGAARVLLGSI